jgi:hypothetical protein
MNGSTRMLLAPAAATRAGHGVSIAYHATATAGEIDV